MLNRKIVVTGTDHRFPCSKIPVIMELMEDGKPKFRALMSTFMIGSYSVYCHKTGTCVLSQKTEAEIEKWWLRPTIALVPVK